GKTSSSPSSFPWWHRNGWFALPEKVALLYSRPAPASCKWPSPASRWFIAAETKVFSAYNRERTFDRPHPENKMILLKKIGATALVGALFTVTAPGLAHADDSWPSKPISFVVPYAAGGFADTRMRLLARELADELKTSVVVENKAGAGGVIGTAFIVKSKPDGYTIGSGNLAPLSVNPTLMPKNVSYDVQKDIAPVILVEESPLILSVNNNVPVKTVSELIALAKKDPGSLTFGSSGIGGATHVSGELCGTEAGVKLSHVPYKGGAPAAADLMAGHIDMMFEMGYAAMPSIQSKKVHPLEVTSDKRLTLLPY